VLSPIVGLHHVTAIASDPQRTLDFYSRVLGLRLVKRTVNFDDPGTYHLYFGDDKGSPGTILTFFPWVGARLGYVGSGETCGIAFSAPLLSLDFWKRRLADFGVLAENDGERFGEPVIRFRDPDGMRLEIVAHDHPGEFTPSRAGEFPVKHAIRGFHGVTLCESQSDTTGGVLQAMGLKKTAEEASRIRFEANGNALGNKIDLLITREPRRGRLGAGSVHHIAFRVPDDSSQFSWLETLSALPLDVTDVRDRIYFHSIYFREPGGVLFELATDPPGFTYDEPLEELGQSLKLPPWLEEQRPQLEQVLPLIELRHQKVEQVNERSA
jgi:glyoxalase family protein